MSDVVLVESEQKRSVCNGLIRCEVSRNNFLSEAELRVRRTDVANRILFVVQGETGVLSSRFKSSREFPVDYYTVRKICWKNSLIRKRWSTAREAIVRSETIEGPGSIVTVLEFSRRHPPRCSAPCRSPIQ